MKIKTVLLPLFAAVLLAVSPISAVAEDANGKYSSYAIGKYSCASFLKDEEHKANANINAFWIGGFMTAAGKYNDTEKAFGDVADIEGILHLIRAYCDENPLDSLEHAAEYVVHFLLAEAGRR